MLVSSLNENPVSRPVGSIASSAITGIVFHTSVSDSGVHLIAWIMVGVSLVLVLIAVLDRILPDKAGS